jgi:hypothetical protein
MAQAGHPTVCGECGKEFDAKGTKREICYRLRCVKQRKRKWNQAKVERVRTMKQEGQWKEHKKEVAGIGKGGTGELKQYRNCLRCLQRFAVPLDTDWRICPHCHELNDTLIAECTDEALGLVRTTLAFRDDAGHTLSKRPCG